MTAESSWRRLIPFGREQLLCRADERAVDLFSRTDTLAGAGRVAVRRDVAAADNAIM
jgi:hypothetical protein